MILTDTVSHLKFAYYDVETNFQTQKKVFLASSSYSFHIVNPWLSKIIAVLMSLTHYDQIMSVTKVNWFLNSVVIPYVVVLCNV